MIITDEGNGDHSKLRCSISNWSNYFSAFAFCFALTCAHLACCLGDEIRPRHLQRLIEQSLDRGDEGYRVGQPSMILESSFIHPS